MLVLVLLLNPTLCGILNMFLIPSNGVPLPMITNNTASPLFTPYDDKFTCSYSVIYEYAQTPNQFQQNSNYTLKIVSDALSKLSVSTLYNHFSPNLSSSSCLFNCSISITNNCPAILQSQNYFDQIYIEIDGIVVSYMVNCNQNFIPNIFEWGLLVIILFITILITLSSVYSRAWSIGGFGLRLGYIFLGIYTTVFVSSGIMAVFFTSVVNGIADALCWALGICAVSLCFNEALFPLKIKFLHVPLLGSVRSLDILSLIVGLGTTIAWWLTNRNWIVNDILAICICIAFIKVFKFISLKTSLIYTAFIVATQVTIALFIHYFVGSSYNSLIMNTFNNPLEIQFPTINPMLNQKCSWIPITEVVYPGIFLSYMRRFDDSRGTHMYLIISCITFCVASLCWMVVTVFNFHSWPLDTFTQPALLLIVIVFAQKRNQIKTVWEGKFYDIEFMNNDDIDDLRKKLSGSSQGEPKQVLNQSLMKGLKIDQASERESQLPGSHYIRDAL